MIAAMSRTEPAVPHHLLNVIIITPTCSDRTLNIFNQYICMGKTFFLQQVQFQNSLLKATIFKPSFWLLPFFIPEQKKVVWVGAQRLLD